MPSGDGCAAQAAGRAAGTLVESVTVPKRHHTNRHHTSRKGSSGPQTAEAEALLRREPEWAAPVLWKSEWRSVLTHYLRRGELDRATAIQLVEAASGVLAGREYPIDDQAVIDLVLGSRCSAYDCEYVATAQALGVPLATWDKEVLKAFPRVAVRPDRLRKR